MFSHSISFGQAQISQVGLRKFKDLHPELAEKADKTIEKAQNSVENDLILDDNGRFYINSPVQGTFTVDYPPCPKNDFSTFKLNTLTPEGKKSRCRIMLSNLWTAAVLASKSFAPNKPTPEGVLDLYSAMEDAASFNNR